MRSGNRHGRNFMTGRLLGGLAACVLAPALLLSGCEGSTSGGGGEQGEVVIGLTDAQGDLLSYTVDVTSVTLTRADGTRVETLPLTTRLDFGQYTEMTEILTAASVPSGVYVKGSMTLDYANADIQVEDATGDPLRVDAIVDAAGDPIGTLEVEVHLEDRDRLIIRRGRPAHMTLDFDLQASNRVSFDTQGVPTLTVEPFLLADVELERPKIQRVRGPLRGVDLGESSYRVIIRPFHQRLDGNHDRFGALDVLTDQNTVFDVDNQSYTGAPGLEALAAKPAFTATVAIGELRFRPRRFVAREVLAGSSVPGGELDAVHGTVRARTGNLLTLRGATLVRAAGSVALNHDVQVTLGDGTVVRKQFSDAMHGPVDISVGQHLRVFGTLIDGSDPLQLEASNGFAHMLLSSLSGTRVDAPADPDQELVVDLQRLNGRRPALYDFTGTGSAPGDDALPGEYEIDIGTLDLGAIGTGAPLEVRGFVRPFGSAPADFEARTVIDLGGARAVLATTWDPASGSAFSVIGADGLVLDLGGVGPWHHVRRGGTGTDLTLLPAPVRVAPDADGGGVFVIGEGPGATVHTHFAAFAEDLGGRIGLGALVHGIRASGNFDDPAATLSARTVLVQLR